MAANPTIQLGTDGNWAIKEDNLLAYKKDGDRFFNKEFDFTRGSLATFVDKDGLIKYSGVTDTELVTNGNFDNNSDWIPETNVTFSVSNGVANVFSTQAFRGIYQLSSITAGKIYKGTITYKSDYDIRFYIGGSSFSLLSSSSDFTTETVYINAIGNSSIYALPTQINQTIEIDNVSVVEIQTDVPRIDFTDDATGHLLLEPQSTNLVTYSEDFSGWTKQGNISISSNNNTSPSGSLDATLLSITDTSTTTKIQQTTTVTSGNTYTFSVYLKSDSNLTLEIGGISGSHIVVNTTNEWQRFSVTQVASSNNRYPQVKSNGTQGNFYMWGAQLEQLPYATSYIPTYGSTATRNADVCNNSGSAQDFNSEEGVLYAEIAANVETNSANARINIHNGSATEMIRLGYTTTQNQIIAVIVNGGVQAALSTIVSNITLYNKCAIKYKTNDFALWVNGFEVDTDTSGTTPSGLNELSFEKHDGIENFYGKTKNLKVFKRAMSDGELYLLTVPQYQSYQEMATALNYTL
jgi:hypothetical protein